MSNELLAIPVQEIEFHAKLGNTPRCLEIRVLEMVDCCYLVL